jgi:hypothetical protein
MLDMFSSIYNIGRLPATRKMTRLILLNKPGKDPRLASAYRPISILPAISKIWENTFKTVTENELGLDPFHWNQSGFCRRSTIDAISQVSKFADLCRKKGLICEMMRIDVKNAFNTLLWEVILQQVRRRGLFCKLARVLANYLKDRVVVLDNLSGQIKRRRLAGGPQGSIVGSMLWS